MEKLAGEIIGLPVVTLDGGTTIAHVQDMIVDPTRRQVLALVVQERGFMKAARAIPFGRIVANGRDAVVVQNEKVMLDLDRDPVLKGLDNGHRVQGADVMTDDGRKVGTVSDMLIDDHTGEIKYYDLRMGADSPDAATYQLPSDGVVSLGKEILYVSAATATSAGLVDDKATRAIDVGSTTQAEGEMKEDSVPDDKAAKATPTALVDGLIAGTVGATSGVTNMMGGTTLNTRLLFGIVILVLGILILVYPGLLPLIAGISLIVIGLWVALQNAAGAGRP
jgi:uncharacterized protein YrrD